MKVKSSLRQRLSQSITFGIIFVFVLQTAVFGQTRGVRVKVKDENTNTTEEVELYKGSYALVIGAVNYDPKSGWKRLNGVKTDVPAVVDVLKNKQKFDVVETLVDPTSINFTQKMSEFVNKYGLNPENRILIYYAGHGYTETESDGRKFGYLVPVDAPDPKKDFQGFIAKSVSMDDIENLAKRIRSKHALFVFDSCFSGTLINRNKISVPPIINYLSTQNVRQFITSGEAGEEVPDESIFREMFVRGLDGEADKAPFGNNDGFITASELAYFLQDRVIYYAKSPQTPQYGKIRDPRLDRGDFIFTISNNVANVQPVPSPRPTPLVENSKSGEDVYWEEVTKLNTKSAFQSYLSEYPSGKHGATARLKIKNIEDAEREAEENRQAEAARNAKQAEQTKWAEAERLNTIEGYRSYLNNYPNGDYKGVANLRINDLNAKAESAKLRNPTAGMTLERPIGGGLSMKFAGVPSGSFMMGSPESEANRDKDEGPVRKVTISQGFWLSKYEVTIKEWKAVMGDLPEGMKKDLDAKFYENENQPVVQVSWDDAKAYIAKLNAKNDGFIYSLPSEAEWEYAARAGTTGAFGIGDGNSLSSSQANFAGNYPYGGAAKGKYLKKTTPVGSYQPNAFGLYDMHGNVWEWCEDIWKDSYEGLGVDGSSNVSVGDSSKRVLRGGSWYYHGSILRSAYRSRNSPANRDFSIGFRVAVRVR